MPEPSFEGSAEYDFIGRDARPDPDVFVWLLNLSAIFQAAFFPTGKIDIPVGSFTSPLAPADLPPPGRQRLMLVDGVWSFVTSGGAVTPVSAGAGITSFLGLTDTPGSYAGAALQSVRVNAGETALEFSPAAGGGLDPVREMPAVNFFNNTAPPASYRLTGISYGRLGLLRESRESFFDGYVTNLPPPTFGVEQVGAGVGHQTSYYDAVVVDDPLAFAHFVHWRVPDDWVSGFDAANAIRVNTKTATVPAGNGGVAFDLEVYHPVTGVSLGVLATRSSGAAETAYVFLAVSGATLNGLVAPGLWAGSLMKFKLRARSVGSTDFGANRARFGEIEVNPA